MGGCHVVSYEKLHGLVRDCRLAPAGRTNQSCYQVAPQVFCHTHAEDTCHGATPSWRLRLPTSWNPDVRLPGHAFWSYEIVNNSEEGVIAWAAAEDKGADLMAQWLENWDAITA